MSSSRVTRSALKQSGAMLFDQYEFVNTEAKMKAIAKLGDVVNVTKEPTTLIICLGLLIHIDDTSVNVRYNEKNIPMTQKYLNANQLKAVAILQQCPTYKPIIVECVCVLLDSTLPMMLFASQVGLQRQENNDMVDDLCNLFSGDLLSSSISTGQTSDRMEVNTTIINDNIDAEIELIKTKYTENEQRLIVIENNMDITIETRTNPIITTGAQRKRVLPDSFKVTGGIQKISKKSTSLTKKLLLPVVDQVKRLKSAVKKSLSDFSGILHDSIDKRSIISEKASKQPNEPNNLPFNGNYNRIVASVNKLVSFEDEIKITIIPSLRQFQSNINEYHNVIAQDIISEIHARLVATRALFESEYSQIASWMSGVELTTPDIKEIDELTTMFSNIKGGRRKQCGGDLFNPFSTNYKDSKKLFNQFYNYELTSNKTAIEMENIHKYDANNPTFEDWCYLVLPRNITGACIIPTFGSSEYNDLLGLFSTDLTTFQLKSTKPSIFDQGYPMQVTSTAGGKKTSKKALKK